MSEQSFFPAYIPRDEEQRILEEVARVRQDRKSHAVLLYGPGGVGKTSLVRRLAKAHAADQETIWVDPVDIDDSEYWLLSNLERHVASGLDPENAYFGPYRKYLSRLPSYTGPRVGYETIVSHLARIKRIFAECYQEFIADNRKTVVIVLDTVEVIRGMYLLQTLTQWMKALPATLFVLAGRPPTGPGEVEDPIRRELADPHQPLLVSTVWLSEFTWDAALDYLKRSGVAGSLSAEEMDKLVYLTQGHPLWLAFTVDYLRTTGIPEEAAEIELGELALEIPFRGNMTMAGQARDEKFKRRLVAPYRETDFWHEALRRLAVVRESINQPVWESLMADRQPPDGVSSVTETWDRLLQIPWIRPRANRRYVTLHDAVAAELAVRLIPVHDQDRTWRRQLWQRARDIYAESSEALEATLHGELGRLDDAMLSWAGRPESSDEPWSAEDDRRLIRATGRLEARKRELSQMKAVGLYYELLCDFSHGSRLFLDLLEQSRSDHDILFQDLLAAEIQRFLPGGVHAHESGDVVGEAIDAFRTWLRTEGRDTHLDIGVSLADYLIRSEKPEQALSLLGLLPIENADPLQRYRLSNLRGNACMRIPGRFREARRYFEDALGEATVLSSDDRLRLVAKAHKELGFYHRNGGRWGEADESYQQARNAISETLMAGSTPEDREEMASIQANWAYVKGLTGHYRDGTNLALSAISVRRWLGNDQEEGISWSVCGEVYRYERRFQKAWEAYAQAERIFQRLRNWAWLGLIYQEQAICLFQAVRDGVYLRPDAITQAKRLITVALDLCRDLAIRGYPSALNRAGRIYGAEDTELGLRFLADGIEEGRKLSDGWFWFANLVEHAELCYEAWVKEGGQIYLDQINAHAQDIASAMQEYEFPDLKGRWYLLQGHLLVRGSLASGDESVLDDALEFYKNGLALISKEYVGSSGAASIADEFKTLGELLQDLSPRVREEWQMALRRAWSEEISGATVLLAGLEELY